jgi:heat shock protein HslJ
VILLQSRTKPDFVTLRLHTGGSVKPSVVWLLAGSIACVGSPKEEQHPPPSADSVAAAAGAAESSAAQTTPVLIGTTWRLTELDGKPAPLGQDGKAATLELAAEGNRATGFAGCNRMTGAYVRNGDSLRLGPFALTRMACENGMELEKQYVDALQRTRTYRQSAERLELLDSSGTLARLEAQ